MFRMFFEIKLDYTDLLQGLADLNKRIEFMTQILWILFDTGRGGMAQQNAVLYSPQIISTNKIM